MLERSLFEILDQQIKLNKSILLLGPRQVGKTTLAGLFKYDLEINLARFRDRIDLEKDPGLLGHKIQTLQRLGAQNRSFNKKKTPLIFIDEVQLVPHLLSEIQVLIDQKRAQFILTGSSARKLRSEVEANLIPGRVVNLRLDPLSLREHTQSIEEALVFGQLPEVSLTKSLKQKDLLLRSYVENYIEDEIRKETKIRNVVNYARFLELAAMQSGEISNFTQISRELGPTVVTIQSYFQILEDTLFAERIDPYLKNSTRKKLTKSSRYLFYDLGVRRVSAREGKVVSADRKGKLFEHLVGNEILKWIRSRALPAHLYFWRDPDGPEVDWLIEFDGQLLPIEVKLSNRVIEKDTRHLRVFLSEYKEASMGLVVNNSDLWFDFDARIQVVGLQNLHDCLDQIFK